MSASGQRRRSSNPSRLSAVALTSDRYFSPVIARLHRGDRILIVNKSITREAEVVLIGLNEHLARYELQVRQSLEYPRSTIGQADPDDLYGMEDKGLDGWLIRRKSDGVVMSKGLPNYDAALQQRRRLHENKLVA
jgi:hypothetical protein